ncbi:hypothetical protein U9M48_013410 [Paspalum notatum var. saurae]|uniref:Reverse transcriptase domain-containing protein n=1 Tax=Paspalum notatum var. saurae TaxID=547442 RepID=A0AAQ3WJJ3_PASNO
MASNLGTRIGRVLPVSMNPSSILVWNVRGLNRKAQRNSVRDLAEAEGRTWWFSGVYGPQEDEDKLVFLQELRDIRASCSGPWAVAGDFNLIYQAADKNNNNFNRAMMGRFRCFLDDLELKETPLLGRKFTWSNERDSPTLVRLDHVFCSAEWDEIFPDAVLQSTTAGARYRKKKIFISKLQVEDRLYVSQDEKQEVVADFYENLLGSAGERDYYFNLAAFHTQQQHDLSPLEAPFTEEEVWAVIRDLPMDKAPSPDGFTGRFYKCCWNIICSDVLAALYAIYGGHVLKFRLLNSAYITLLPKTGDASTVKNYRPISLIHSFAKLVTKILATRLTPMLPKLVSNNQSAFVRGRNIHDNFLLVQQLARAMHRSKEPHILLKLDISKAFDSVSWSFLIEVLQHLGFGRRWCNLMSLLLSTSSTQVLVNGVPGRLIHHRRGLRQGDPLSPMLFILVMDVLNSLIQVASSSNLLLPLAGRCSWPRISLYADDAVIFLRPESMDLSVIRDLLQCFGAVAGLKTNLLKSSAIPIQCSEEDVARTSAILSCSVGGFPCSYLGIPLTIWKPSKADLLPLIDKIANKLPGWKAPLLSKAGRLVVVKYVLSATPIHLMIALDLPKWVIKAVDKRRRGFLWKGQEQANGAVLMYGGLGVHDLERMGWALRMRWLWFMKTDASKPWAGLPIQIPSQAKALFEMAVEMVVGNGENTKFWTDKWLHGRRLADIAPNLLRAIPKRVAKRRTVSQALTNRCWVSDIKGALTVQVLTEYLHVWELLEGVELQPDTPDTPIWRPSSSGCYSSKSAYEVMFIGTIKFSPWKQIWKTWAPAKCSFFIWLVINNRCWTADRLAKRGLPHHPACPLCDQAAETINHVLSSCVLAREVWTLVLQRLNIIVRPPDQDSRLNSWWCRAVSLLPKEMRKGFNSLLHGNYGSIGMLAFLRISDRMLGWFQAVANEGHLWCLAGARALQDLVLRASS